MVYYYYIIKKGFQCKAWREQLKHYQSEDPGPTLPHRRMLFLCYVCSSVIFVLPKMTGFVISSQRQHDFKMFEDLFCT